MSLPNGLAGGKGDTSNAGCAGGFGGGGGCTSSGSELASSFEHMYETESENNKDTLNLVSG